jgi:hypothetical protein
MKSGDFSTGGAGVTLLLVRFPTVVHWPSITIISLFNGVWCFILRVAYSNFLVLLENLSIIS